MFGGENHKMVQIVFRYNLETGEIFVSLGFGGFEDKQVHVSGRGRLGCCISAWGGGTGRAAIFFQWGLKV